MLSLMLFLPLAGGIFLLFFRNPRAIKGIALGASLLSAYVSIVALGRFDLHGGMQLLESYPGSRRWASRTGWASTGSVCRWSC